MTALLIKTENNLILCNDEKIEEGDLFIDLRDDEPYEEDLYHAGSGGSTEFANSIGKKVIAQLPNIKLSEEVAEEIGWFDVEELANNLFWSVGNEGISSKDSYIKGFQKAQELNQKKYSENDVLQILETYEKEKYDGSKRETMFFDKNLWLNKYIQSLSKNQWQVEVTEIDGTYHVNKILK